MRDKVTKAQLVASLAETLKLTREQVQDLELSRDENTVTIIYEGGYRVPVNVHIDSGIALIRDVCKRIS